MDMIEKVARAIAKREVGNLAFVKIQEDDKPKFRRAIEADTHNAMLTARAAIEAMRDPTNQMVDDQGGEYVNLERADDQSYQPRLIWQGMIDTALEEK